ncbi:MAG: hypothetical protein ABR968_07740 [Bacteroidales bacterium]
MRNLIFIISFFLVPLFSIAQEKGFKAEDDDGDNPTGILCGGTERWAVKVLADAAASSVNYTPIATTIDSLIHISTPTPSTSAPRGLTPLEYKTFFVHCNIKELRPESDNDYHLVLHDINHPTETMIGEVPDPTCSVAATSAHVSEFISARNWVSTHIGTTENLSVNIPEVCITGVAFEDPPHGQSGAAPNNLELHSIIGMEYCTLVGIDVPVSPRFTAEVNPTAFSESTNFHVMANTIKLGTCTLDIYDLKSNKVQSLNLPVSNNKEINYTFHKGNLVAGMYIYRIWNDNTILYEGKLVIQ